MKLIMESGATKTDCCLLDSGGKVRSRFRIPGINVATMDFEAVSRVARDAVSCLRSAFSGELPEGAIKEIFFYGAGVLEGQADGQKHFQTGENPDSVSGNDRISGACVPETLDSVLAEAFPGSGREYHSDLLAAARGLCGDRAGIVAILGTGSNSCLYDGKRIVRNIRPGGFILGDEGSAAALGRLFLADYIKELLPEEVAEDFRNEYGLDYASVVKFVYGSDAPARNLASLAPYVMRWAGNEWINDMIVRNFRDFFERCLMRYGAVDAGIYVTGSFGNVCRDVLESLGHEYGLEFQAFVPAPMSGLEKYHASSKNNPSD